MTKTEIERLAVVETKVDVIRLDVDEIKGDVKTLLASRAQASGVAAFLVKSVPFVALALGIVANWVAAAQTSVK